MQMHSTVDVSYRFVPEKQACVVERFGRFSRVMTPGLGITIPVVREYSWHSCYTYSKLACTEPTDATSFLAACACICYSRS